VLGVFRTQPIFSHLPISSLTLLTALAFDLRCVDWRCVACVASPLQPVLSLNGVNEFSFRV
jgi:hypothetical protein